MVLSRIYETIRGSRMEESKQPLKVKEEDRRKLREISL